jgi:glycosidase
MTSAFPRSDASYGRPEDFKAFVEATRTTRGIAVLLDVVYNHFGPEEFPSLYAPDFFTSRHKTPWGDAIQLDGTNSRPVRDFFIENAEYWIEGFILTGCASTPFTRSRMIRGLICSTNSRRAFARGPRGPSISSWKTRTMSRSA